MAEHPEATGESGEDLRSDIVGDERDLAALVALAGLPGLSPPRFRSMVTTSTPNEMWKRIIQGHPPRSQRARDPANEWVAWARGVDPFRRLAVHRDRGVHLAWYGGPGYPSTLVDDPDPPVMLFSVGYSELLHNPGVAVVGTRRCTRYGRDVAREIGAVVAAHGITVASGLAHGIDAAAHAGAQSADASTMLGIVAGGLDLIYPKGNSELWRNVSRHGCLLSEVPLGAPALKWRFPARNRLVAALSQVVVVVESPEKGGSMYTVDEALRRDRHICAVPGPIRSPASAGTNRLIADGAMPVCATEEIVELIAPSARVGPSDTPTGGTDGRDAGDTPTGGTDGRDAGDTPQSWLLEHLSFEPTALDDVMLTTGRTAAELTLEVERLIATGIVHRTGLMVERIR